MVDSKRPIHELAPMTDRSAKILAKRYGFNSLDEMARSLSKNAKVIDFGAGASDLGTEIAKRRSDVSWINFDLNYDARTLSELKQNTPVNLIYMQGDILKAGSMFKAGSVDCVFSYALLPHIELTDPVVAKKVLQAMSLLLKEDGVMYLGRRFAPRLLGSAERRAGSVVITRDEIEHDPKIVDRTLGLMRVSGPSRWVQKTMNATAVSSSNGVDGQPNPITKS